MEPFILCRKMSASERVAMVNPAKGPGKVGRSAIGSEIVHDQTRGAYPGGEALKRTGNQDFRTRPGSLPQSVREAVRCNRSSVEMIIVRRMRWSEIR
jgi:hypothetical protein